MAKGVSNDSKTFAFIATFLSIIGFVIAIVTQKKDRYVNFYAKQSLVVFIFSAVVGLFGKIFGWVPIIGWIIYGAAMIIVIVLWVLSWVYALSGEMKEVPLIGQYGKSFDF